MGAASSIAWVVNADSISSPGQQVILSDPIEGMGPEDYFKIMEMYIRERPLYTAMYEVKREVEDMPDGGIHEIVSIEVTGVAAMVAGNIKATIHNVYHFKPDEGEFVYDAFYGDETLTNVCLRTLIKVHKSPFRLECISDEFETRKSGPMLEGLVKTKLAAVGYDVEVKHSVPSPSGSGEKSIVSAEIADADLTIQSLWEKISSKTEADGEGTMLPDGSMVVESSMMVAVMGTQYFRWSLEEADQSIKSMDFGYDERMDELKALSYWKVHENPKCVEVWAMSVPGRRAGEGMRKVIEEMHTSALKLKTERG